MKVKTCLLLPTCPVCQALVIITSSGIKMVLKVFSRLG